MYHTIRQLVKMLRPRSQWQIDVIERSEYDENDKEIGTKICFKVDRWHKDYLHYENVAEFDTINEAFDFVRKYKSFPVNADEVV
jgi:hypothetical protein